MTSQIYYMTILLTNRAPQMWDLITVSDGTTRQLQWTSRVEGDTSITNSTRKPQPTLPRQGRPRV